MILDTLWHHYLLACYWIFVQHLFNTRPQTSALSLHLIPVGTPDLLFIIFPLSFYYGVILDNGEKAGIEAFDSLFQVRLILALFLENKSSHVWSSLKVMHSNLGGISIINNYTHLIQDILHHLANVIFYIKKTLVNINFHFYNFMVEYPSKVNFWIAPKLALWIF